MSKKYFITGGQGFLGGWIMRNLISGGLAPKQIICMDLEKNDHLLGQILDPAQLKDITRVSGDVADADFVRSTVLREKPTHVLHLAGLQIPTCRANPLLGARVNVLGTLAVFEAVKALREAGGKVGPLVYTSSAGIFGAPADYVGRAIQDNDLHRSMSHYGVFKTANEGNARVYWAESRLPSIGLRPLTVYGVGREIGLTSGPTKAIKAAVLNQKYTIGFTGKTAFNYIEDIAQICITCAESNVQAAHTYNIKGEVLDVADFVAAIENVLPSARGLIVTSGAQLPLAYDFEEAGLAALYPSGVAPVTPAKTAVQRIAGHFLALKAAGRLNTRDLA